MAKIKLHKLWREPECKEFQTTSWSPLKKADDSLGPPSHLSTSINDNNSPQDTWILTTNSHIYLPCLRHISAILSSTSWSKSQHKQLCPGNAILLRFSTASKIVARGKFSGLMTRKTISCRVRSASVCSLEIKELLCCPEDKAASSSIENKRN